MSVATAEPRAAAEATHRVFLVAGEIHVATQPSLISTVLGSCVAVCLWDMRSRIGGMNHYMLPTAGSANVDSVRYGDNATDALVVAMVGHGACTGNLRARIYGGASLLPFGDKGTGIGERNLEMAAKRLQAHRIPVVGSRTGGREGLIVRFDTGTGDISIQGTGVPVLPPLSDAKLQQEGRR